MTDINNIFFELIQVAIGTRICLSHTPLVDEWGELYAMAKKQSLVGVCFAGVQRLQQQRQEPPKMLYLTWMGMAAKIQQRNELISQAVGKVNEHYDKEGFDMVLLKGQGNLCNYPEHLRGLRTPGDIDAWIMPKGFEKLPLSERMRNDEIVLKHFWKKDTRIRHCYLHIHEDLFDGIDVEVHYRPSYINSPMRNARFQRWIVEEAPRQCANMVSMPGTKDVQVAVPTAEFNVVYQLSHLYRHIFDDGLGLRQVLDYYFVLRTVPEGFKVSEFQCLIKRLGLKRFAQALMYVMHEVLGLEEKFYLCEPDPVAGKFLQDEIMMAGNFGHYDEREKVAKHENGVQRLLRRQMRNMRFFGYYAEEVLSVPLYRMYQEYWRIKMNIKCK